MISNETITDSILKMLDSANQLESILPPISNDQSQTRFVIIICEYMEGILNKIKTEGVNRMKQIENAELIP